MHLRDCTFWAVFRNLLFCVVSECAVCICVCVFAELWTIFLYICMYRLSRFTLWQCDVIEQKRFQKIIFRPKVSKIKLLERAGVVRYSTICSQVCNWQFRYSGAPPGVGCSAAKCCVDCVDCFVVVCGFCSVVCSFFFHFKYTKTYKIIITRNFSTCLSLVIVGQGGSEGEETLK